MRCAECRQDNDPGLKWCETCGSPLDEYAAGESLAHEAAGAAGSEPIVSRTAAFDTRPAPSPGPASAATSRPPGRVARPGAGPRHPGPPAPTAAGMPAYPGSGPGPGQSTGRGTAAGSRPAPGTWTGAGTAAGAGRTGGDRGIAAGSAGGELLAGAPGDPFAPTGGHPTVAGQGGDGARFTPGGAGPGWGGGEQQSAGAGQVPGVAGHRSGAAGPAWGGHPPGGGQQSPGGGQQSPGGGQQSPGRGGQTPGRVGQTPVGFTHAGVPADWRAPARRAPAVPGRVVAAGGVMVFLLLATGVVWWRTADDEAGAARTTTVATGAPSTGGTTTGAGTGAGTETGTEAGTATGTDGGDGTGSGNRPTENAAVGDTTPDRPTSAAASGDPAEQARALDRLLYSSRTSRGKLNAAIGAVQGCSDLAGSVQRIREAAQERTAEKAGLSRLDLTALDGYEAGRADLGQALSASAAADAAFADWAEERRSNGCRTTPAVDRYWRAGRDHSARATAKKNDFLGFWNPVAVRYGLSRRVATDI
jgi:hypothetical protein